MGPRGGAAALGPVGLWAPWIPGPHINLLYMFVYVLFVCLVLLCKRLSVSHLAECMHARHLQLLMPDKSQVFCKCRVDLRDLRTGNQCVRAG